MKHRYVRIESRLNESGTIKREGRVAVHNQLTMILQFVVCLFGLIIKTSQTNAVSFAGSRSSLLAGMKN